MAAPFSNLFYNTENLQSTPPFWKQPGQRNSLDALCKRYGVDNTQRRLHGALLDAEILADVYLLMTSGQSSLLLKDEQTKVAGKGTRNPKLDPTRKPLADR